MIIIDDEVLPSDYLDNLNLPPREELWAAVQEAHDYLYDWVNDPSTRSHEKYGHVSFDATDWGTAMPNGNGCWVCLAGLRYLRKESGLLGEASIPISDTDLFLDALRDMGGNREQIEDWLGVQVPVDIDDQLCIGDPEFCEDILTFLDWLLKQRVRYGQREVQNAV